MKGQGIKLAAFKVLERWMPEIEKAAIASGQDAGRLLEDALINALPKVEEVDIDRMIAEAEASGFEPIGDLDAWREEQQRELRASFPTAS